MTIIEEIRTDPEAGARRLERECKPGLLALARRLCADHGDAEELVNRTLAEAVAHIDSLLSQSALFGWMCQILVGCHSKDTRRKSNDEIVYPGTVPDVPDEASQEAIFRNLDHAMLRDAIDNLPKEDREILLLHYFMDIPIPRMAKVLAIPAGTVKSRLHYARRALAAKLGAATKKPGARALLAALLLTALSAGAAVVAMLSAATTDGSRRQAIAFDGLRPLAAEDNSSSRPSDHPTDKLPAFQGASAQNLQASATPSTFNLSTLQPFNPPGDAMNTKTRATILSAATALALTAANAQTEALHVSSAPSWTIEERTTAIAPLDFSVNALYGREAYSVTNNNVNKAVNTAWSLTDGEIKFGQDNPGLNIYNNSSIRWKLSDNPGGVDLKSIRVISTWSNKGRAQFAVASVAVKTVAGGDAWQVLANSGATGPAPTQKAAFLGTFADGNGDILALGATDLMIDFGPSQQNSYVGYTEVEAKIVPRSAEPSWTSVVLTNAVPMVSSLNALYNLKPDSFVNGGTTANPNNAAVLTDGEIPLKTNTKIVQINGNGTAGSSLEYSLDPGGVDLRNVRISSSWGDGGRSQIRIESLAVKTLSGGGTWQTLDNSALSGRPSISVPNWQATYSRLDGEAIATGATALMVVFDKTQQNGYVGYSEIEAEMIVAEVTMKLTVQYPASYGSVTMSPASGDGAYEADAEVSLTAAAAAGYTFLHWYGDVPAGHEYDNPLTIDMTSDKTVYPLFSGPWQWAGGVMTDGYWRVTAPLAEGSLSMTEAEPLFGFPPLLDLRKGIAGTAAPLASLEANVLRGNLRIGELRLPDTVATIKHQACANMTGLTNIVLSSGLQTIGAGAFQGCQALTTVSPLLPESVSSIGASAFSNVPLSGTLTISGKSLTVIPNEAFYATSAIADGRASLKQVDLSGSGVESIDDENAFRGRLGITDVFLPATLSYLGKDAFYPDGTSGMRSIYFESCPAGFHAKAFEGVATTARIVIYRDDQEWKDFLANAVESFTAWSDLSAADKALYTFDDSCVPYGRAKIGANGSIVFVATRKRSISKATIISVR